MVVTNKLTNLQLELIKIFSYQLPENQIIEIKNILAEYFADKASDEMDKLWEEKSWTNETMITWVNEHLKTPYKRK